MAKDIVNSSFGHIKENQTFAIAPQEETENVATINDLKKRGIKI